METLKQESITKQIEAIAKNYFVATRNIRSHICGFSSCDEVGLSAYQNYVERVNRAYDYLDEEEKSIVNNEFFFQDYPNWWCKIYKRSTFLNKRRNAVKKFLRYFYE